eukprot:gnl/MRDRNA2_/MRDRNA2_109168_c0_seq1.p1 gnl/MRDRNA2_/MRDRNA2_109168_c0~~gnl/MRDRNA2_/MRDRNA2_109168_c0_seq1.p1  ORF type:complete len:137 (-),score=9.27 gnl/MRDRNA2_/MRDRNA2_109168_c0_seq1:53-463(-)
MVPSHLEIVKLAQRSTRSVVSTVTENPVVPLVWWMISCLVAGQAMLERSEDVKRDLAARILPILQESSDKNLSAQVSSSTSFPAFFLRIIVLTICIVIDDKYGYLCSTSVGLVQQYRYVLLWALLGWVMWSALFIQ